jgi:speckle-type POZ protein
VFLGAHCPENVSGILRDENKKLEELIPGHWNGRWRVKRKPGSCFCWQKPTLVLILDFQSSAEEQTLNRMSSLLDARSMADIQFIVQGEKISAHLAVVASASPVIEAMFQGNRFKEGTTKTVRITDVSPEAFKHLLQFVYTGKIPTLSDSTETMEMLFFAADKYEIQDLKDICENKLARQVSKRNAIHLLIVAHLHSATKLQEAALRCIDRNRQYIWGTTEWQDLLTKYPTLFYTASKKMALEPPRI